MLISNKNLGGYEGSSTSDEFLEFDPPTGQWKLVSKMIQARGWHAVSVINFESGLCVLNWFNKYNREMSYDFRSSKMLYMCYTDIVYFFLLTTISRKQDEEEILSKRGDLIYNNVHYICHVIGPGQLQRVHTSQHC